jgi:hypothetical protein
VSFFYNQFYYKIASAIIASRSQLSTTATPTYYPKLLTCAIPPFAINEEPLLTDSVLYGTKRNRGR